MSKIIYELLYLYTLYLISYILLLFIKYIIITNINIEKKYYKTINYNLY